MHRGPGSEKIVLQERFVSETGGARCKIAAYHAGRLEFFSNQAALAAPIIAIRRSLLVRRHDLALDRRARRRSGRDRRYLPVLPNERNRSPHQLSWSQGSAPLSAGPPVSAAHDCEWRNPLSRSRPTQGPCTSCRMPSAIPSISLVVSTPCLSGQSSIGEVFQEGQLEVHRPSVSR